MNPGALVSLFASLLCLEIAIAFALLYAKVSHRGGDAVFSGLAFCLFVMTYAAFAEVLSREPERSLFWLRMEYASAFAATTVLFHFVCAVVGRRLSMRALALTCTMGSLLAVFALSEMFLTFPPPSRLRNIEAISRGPLFPVFASALVASAFYSWMQLIRGIQSQRERTFAPLSRHIKFIILGGAFIIIAGAADVISIILTPQFTLGFDPLPVAVAIFCILTAIALGHEIIGTVRERERLSEQIAFRDQAVREVAHELKNPLAGIQGSASTILKGMDRDLPLADQKTLLKMCVSECKRLTRTLNNMLDTARLESGRDAEIRLQDTLICGLIEAVIESHRTTSPFHRLHMESTLRHEFVRIDADKIHQVLFNLVNNAVKYSPQGGNVTVRVWDKDQELCFSVSDEGIGMTPEQQQRIFQPFERVSDGAITGTGIGLHLVKRLIESHGGSICVHSEYGKGSTFTFHVAVRENGAAPDRH